MENDPALGQMLATRGARQARNDAIMNAPEVKERHLLAFAIALRAEIPTGRAIALLAEAPDLRGVDEITAWVDAIPARPSLEIVK